MFTVLITQKHRSIFRYPDTSSLDLRESLRPLARFFDVMVDGQEELMRGESDHPVHYLRDAPLKVSETRAVYFY